MIMDTTLAPQEPEEATEEISWQWQQKTRVELLINITKFIHSTPLSQPVSVCTQTDSRLAVSPGCGYE